VQIELLARELETISLNSSNINYSNKENL